MPFTFTLLGTIRLDDLRLQAASAVPSDFKSDERPREEMEAIASSLQVADAALEDWFRNLYIGTARGKWLDQHGADRMILRLPDEPDDVYRQRIPLVEEAVTPDAILNAVSAFLADNGVSGTVTLIELYQDAAHLGRSAFCGVSYRMTSGPMVVLMLPAGTSDDLVLAVWDIVRQKKAGGIAQRVEPLSPAVYDIIAAQNPPSWPTTVLSVQPFSPFVMI